MLGGTLAAQNGWPYGMHPRRLLVFALDGKAKLPKTPPPMFVTPIDDPDFIVDASLAAHGEERWTKTCVWCHGPATISGGGAPDLRASGVMLDFDLTKKIVLDGERIPRGMPKFDDFSVEDVKAIQHYVRQQARIALTAKAAVAKVSE